MSNLMYKLRCFFWRTPSWYISHLHAWLACLGMIFLPVNLLVILVQENRYDPEALWVRIGNVIIRLHACMWRGMLGGALLYILLLAVFPIISIVLKMGGKNVSWRPDRLRLGIAYVFLRLITAIRFFQPPLPELLMHNYYLTEIWVELAHYPKPNYLSAIAAMAVIYPLARLILTPQEWLD